MTWTHVANIWHAKLWLLTPWKRSDTHGQNPWHQVHGLHAIEASPRCDLRCGQGWRAEGELRVLQNPQRLSQLLHHDLQEVHRKGKPHQAQGRDLRQDSRSGCTHTVNEIVNVGTLEKNEFFHCQCYRNRRLARGETLCAIQKNKFHEQQGATFSEPGNLRLPEKRKLWRWRTDLKENLVRILQHGPGRHSVLCQWWKANQLVERAREASWTIAPRVPCLHSSSHRARDKISKRERQNLRASRAQQLYGPKVQFNCGKMGFWTSFIAKVSVSKDVIEHIVWSLGSYCNHSDQNRSNIPRHEGRKRSSVVRLEDRKRRQIGSFRRRQPEPRIFFSVSADIGTSSRSVKPYAKFGTIRRNVRRKRRQKRKHTLKRIGQDGAVSLPPPWSCCDLRWH